MVKTSKIHKKWRYEEVHKWERERERERGKERATKVKRERKTGIWDRK